jgi:hypothetical protein
MAAGSVKVDDGAELYLDALSGVHPFRVRANDCSLCRLRKTELRKTEFLTALVYFDYLGEIAIFAVSAPADERDKRDRHQESARGHG